MSTRQSIDLSIAWTGVNQLNAGQAGTVGIVCKVTL